MQLKNTKGGVVSEGLPLFECHKRLNLKMKGEERVYSQFIRLTASQKLHLRCTNPAQGARRKGIGVESFRLVPLAVCLEPSVLALHMSASGGLLCGLFDDFS